MFSVVQNDGSLVEVVKIRENPAEKERVKVYEYLFAQNSLKF